MTAITSTGMFPASGRYSKSDDSVSMVPGVVAGVVIAVIAFTLSFDALRLLFVACGVNPTLSWGGPVCVDGSIMLCTWAVWGFKKGRVRGVWYPWLGFVLFSCCSIIGNALHAYLTAGGGLPSWVPPVVMSIPPVALMYSTHLIVIIAGDRYDKRRMPLGEPVPLKTGLDVSTVADAPSEGSGKVSSMSSLDAVMEAPTSDDDDSVRPVDDAGDAGTDVDGGAEPAFAQSTVMEPQRLVEPVPATDAPMPDVNQPVQDSDEDLPDVVRSDASAPAPSPVGQETAVMQAVACTPVGSRHVPTVPWDQGNLF